LQHGSRSSLRDFCEPARALHSCICFISRKFQVANTGWTTCRDKHATTALVSNCRDPVLQLWPVFGKCHSKCADAAVPSRRNHCRGRWLYR